MSVRDLNPLELFFFTPHVVNLAAAHKATLDPVVRVNGGADWADRLGPLVAHYRTAVEQEIAEEGDVTKILGDAAVQLARIGPWRRAMEKAAFSSTSPTTRDDLLKVAGYGLGQVRSVKDAKEFMVSVKPLVEKRADQLKERGVIQEMIAFPATALPALERASADVAKEKAEAILARGETAKQAEALRPLVKAIEDGIDLLVSQAAFTSAVESKKLAETVSVMWTAAFGEANVQSQKRVEKGDIPPNLLDQPVPPPPPAE